ncbi:chemotaxis protein CheD [Halobacillus yeomjeoni]|nr:chemotaxis protein CheD [Halobacillus yeomjeoni]
MNLLSNEKNFVHVRMGESLVVDNSIQVQITGLGSCIGLVIYDEHKPITGVAHIMLPFSPGMHVHKEKRSKYADTALLDLVHDMKRKGASVHRLKAKIAGGAQMYPLRTASEDMRVGHRNIRAVKEALKRYSIPLISEDVGGASGRTIRFDPTTKFLHIKKVHEGAFFI